MLLILFGSMMIENDRYPIWFALVIVAALATACGYRFGPPPSGWTGAGRSLSIPVFLNDSLIPEAGAVFTAAARRVFAEEGDFRLQEADQADFILEGRLLSIDEPLQARRDASTGHRIAAKELDIVLQLVLRDHSGLEIWRTRITDRETFLASGDTMRLGDNREQILARLADGMMRSAYQELGEQF